MVVLRDSGYNDLVGGALCVLKNDFVLGRQTPLESQFARTGCKFLKDGKLGLKPQYRGSGQLFRPDFTA